MPYRIENYINDMDRPLVQQLVEYYTYCQFTCNFTKDTMVGKISSLNHFAKYTKLNQLEDLTNNTVFEWMAMQTKTGNMPRTVNNRLKHLFAMVHYFQDEQNMDLPNFQPHKIKKQCEESANRKAYDRETVYEALHYADRRTWLMIKICFDCGLRVNELRQIQIKDLNGPRLLVHGKGRKNRFVILSSEVMVRLQDYIKANDIKDWMWPSGNGRKAPVCGTTIRNSMKKAFALAGIENFCPHELRHSYATDLKKLGAATRSIQAGLGHSSEKITEIYLHDLDSSTLDDLYRLKYSAPAPELR